MCWLPLGYVHTYFSLMVLAFLWGLLGHAKRDAQTLRSTSDVQNLQTSKE